MKRTRILIAAGLVAVAAVGASRLAPPAPARATEAGT